MSLKKSVWWLELDLSQVAETTCLSKMEQELIQQRVVKSPVRLA